ncbi:MAG TPA: PAS domain-containing sensor histidine kinase [Rhizomicrobium sp.]|nr:PAS domain-containing sensor histidine kinase [Rhizomicrobium sp.]
MAGDKNGSGENSPPLSHDLWQRELAHISLAERTAKFGYWRLDLVTDDLVWSPGMYGILGLEPNEREPNNDWLLSQIHPDDVAEIYEKIGAAIEECSTFYYRCRVTPKNLTTHIVDTHGEIETGPDGNAIAVIGVCHDVTQQVQAETDRNRIEQMYRVMATQASDIIMLHEPDGRIIFASDALERVLKRKPSEIENEKFLSLAHPDDKDIVTKLTAMPKPGETITATYRTLHADGHYVWVESTSRAIYDPQTGECQNIIGVTRDITERKTQELAMKAAQDRAEEANRAKSSFLANMSHELRTPLNAIIGFADIMRAEMFGALGNIRYREYAHLVYDSGQLLLDLITDVLDMAKIEAGKLELNFEPIDLSETMKDAARMLQSRTEQAGVTLTANLPVAPISLVADRRALKQILLNLLSNAAKFTLRGGEITLNAQTIDGKVMLSVCDTGIGISQEDLPRLGRPFEQAISRPELSKGGTGLGLSLVRALTEKHGGHMRIESEEGVGTRVYVTLPAAPRMHAASVA